MNANGRARKQAENLVGAVETAFNGVNAIADQPGVREALTAAAAALTPSQKRKATLAKQKAAEQERGQALRNEDAMIRSTLNLDPTKPITRGVRAEYARRMAEQTKESRPGTAVSLSDIVLGLDGMIGETETFFEQQPESPATEDEQRDFDSLDQISTKSFDYMQVFMNAAARLPVAAPPPQPPPPAPMLAASVDNGLEQTRTSTAAVATPLPQPPAASVQAAIQEQSRATTPPGTVDNGLEQELADAKHQLTVVRARRAGLSSSNAGKKKRDEIIALEKKIEKLKRSIPAKGGSYKRRRKARNSTFRRNRKH